MPIDTSMEEDAVENDLEIESQQTLATQSVCEFVTQAVSEAIESDSESAFADKSVKLGSQRSSNRLTKRPRKDNSVDVIFKKSANIKQDTPSIRSKTRRPWELWSVEDKNAFFEALCEYGKDFESIQTYIAQRSKKKGTTTNIIKNKDQVRHFYYRTWHKISKFLKISECVQKQTQELYGLINYAELRKKIGGCLNEKNRLKLNELVFSGVTTVKCKGKKLRIKTPVCRALKKLNNFSDSKEPYTEKLPKDVFVEFRPYTNAAWLQVQNLAQNPRVRTKICLQKRLKPVIEYLQKRWRPYTSKRKEKVRNSLPSYNSDEFCDIQPVLRIKPPRGIKFFPLSMSAIDTASSSDVCLEKYLKLSHHKDINKPKTIINVNLKPLSDKLDDYDEVLFDEMNNNSDYTGESCDNIDVSDFCQKSGNSVGENSYINPLTPPKSVPELELPIEQYTSEVQKSHSSLTCIKDLSTAQSVPSDNSSEEMDCEPLICASDSKSSGVFNNSQPKNVCGDINKESNVSNFNLEDNIVVSSSSRKDFPSEMAEKDKSLGEKKELCKSTDISESLDSVYWRTIQHGWTIEEAGFLTFGELYLLFGKPTTIILEYDFECPEINLNTVEDEMEGQNFKTSELSPVLDKVFEIAHSFFIDPKHRQLSGKQHGRSISSRSKLKMCGLNDKAFKDFASCQIDIDQESNLDSKDAINSDNLLSNTQSSIDCASSPSSDKHVFVMPIGTAPRNIKHPDQNSLKEEIGKLLPCTRRGCRVRRKPLVVQRPLLPREGMRPISGPRSMTVVHFVPPVSPVTTVIPPDSSRINNKISVPSAKNVVNILPPGLPLDMHPIQVPVVKQVQSDSGQSVLLQRSSAPSSQGVINPSSDEEQEIIKNHMTDAKDSVLNMQKESSPDQNHSSPSEVNLPSSADLNALNLDLLAEQPQNIYESREKCTPLSQLSLPDTAAPLVSNESPSASFLDEFSLTKSSMYDSSNLSSCLNADIVTPKECTSSKLSPHHSFRINSSEIQWFNGESTELSLNTFLSSMDTSSKTAVASNTVTETTNLDPSGRLAPVVDSQVRCLLDECSIDFITKFEDLADVINNSSSSDSKQT